MGSLSLFYLKKKNPIFLFSHTHFTWRMYAEPYKNNTVEILFWKWKTILKHLLTGWQSKCYNILQMFDKRQVPAVLLKLKIRPNYTANAKGRCAGYKKLSVETDSTNVQKAFSCPESTEGIKKHAPTTNNVELSSKRPANSFPNA